MRFVMFPCQRYLAQPISRRELLSQAAQGFGGIALTTMLAENALASTQDATTNSSLAAHVPHFPAKAKNVIFLYMDGGPSQVDTMVVPRTKSSAKLNQLNSPTLERFSNHHGSFVSTASLEFP